MNIVLNILEVKISVIQLLLQTLMFDIVEHILMIHM